MSNDEMEQPPISTTISRYNVASPAKKFLDLRKHKTNKMESFLNDVGFWFSVIYPNKVKKKGDL